MAGDEVWFNVGVLLLIVFIHFATVFGVIIPWLSFTWTSISILSSLNLAALMIYVNYVLAWRVHPGTPPPQWVWKTTLAFFRFSCTQRKLSCLKQKPAEVITSTDESGVVADPDLKPAKRGRFCKKCQAHKPPRSHHCSDCKQCVLKMDHHCPWVNNCVGYQNQGHFIRFLAWVVIALFYCLVILISRIIAIGTPTPGPRIVPGVPQSQKFSMGKFPDITPWETAFMALDFLFIVPVLFLVGILLFTHIGLIATNTTTIESYEKEKAEKYASWGRIKPARVAFFS